MQKAHIKQLAARISGTQIKPANERVKAIVDRLLLDLFNVIDDFDVRPEEFWSALSYVTELGKSNEAALLAAGLGIEHYFDVRLDEKEREVGIDPGSTPRTIEGPLYVAGAPVSQGEARIDDGTDEGEILFMDGQVKDTSGTPIRSATIRSSTRARATSISVARSSPTPRGAIGFAASCRPAMAVRPMARPNNSSTCSVVTAAVRLISILWCRRRDTGSSRRRSTSRAIHTCMTTSPSPPVTSSFPR